MHDDSEFKDTLGHRIVRYAEQESQIVERVTELQQALEDVRKRRRSAEALYRAEFGDDDPVRVGHSPDDSGSPAALSPTLYGPVPIGPLFGASWADALTGVLAEAGEPLHVTEIWQRLRDRGFTTTTRDPLRSIVSIAVRTPGVVRAGPNIYTIAGGDA